MRSQSNAEIEFPLLGEPVVVEFANSLYEDPDGVIDFLGTVELARGWFAAQSPPLLADPELIDERWRLRLVQLRAAIRTLLDDNPATASALWVVEAAVNRHRGRIELHRSEDGTITRRLVHGTSHPAAAVATLAEAAIDLMAPDANGRVQVCSRPDCNMRYFQQHHRRRYCNPRCANADRQRRFHNRRKTPNTK